MNGAMIKLRLHVHRDKQKNTAISPMIKRSLVIIRRIPPKTNQWGYQTVTRKLPQDLLYDVTMHVSQPMILTAMAEGELFVVEPQLVVDGGMNVAAAQGTSIAIEPLTRLRKPRVMK